MVLTQFRKKCVILIRRNVVIPYSRPYKYFLYSGNTSYLLKQLYIITMVNTHIFTHFRKQALLITAHSMRHLLFTCRKTKICRRSSHIMNIAFKLCVFCHLHSFFYNGFMASCLNNSSLMKCERTKNYIRQNIPGCLLC